MKAITKKQFRDWIVSSNGRAVRWVKDHTDEGLESVIEEACIRCLVFDRDYNESHSWFLSTIIESSREPERYLRRGMEMYPAIRDRRNRRHVAEWLAEVARRGHAQCQEFIELNWKSELDRGITDLTSAFIEVLRAKAYRQVLTHLAFSRLKKLHDYDYVRDIHDEASNTLGEKRSEQIQKDMLRRFPQLQSVIRIEDPSLFEDDDEDLSFENVSVDLLREWAQDFRHGHLIEWAFKADPNELERAASILDLDMSEQEASNWLRIYWFTPFRGRPDALIRWIDVERTRHVACRALGNVRHPKAREAALRLAKEGHYLNDALEIMVSNFEPGDEQWILDTIQHCKEFNRYHWSMSAAFGIATHNPKGQWREVMRYIYEHTPCELCRLDFAKFMLRRGWLNEDELEDMCWAPLNLTVNGRGESCNSVNGDSNAFETNH